MSDILKALEAAQTRGLDKLTLSVSRKPDGSVSAWTAAALFLQDGTSHGHWTASRAESAVLGALSAKYQSPPEEPVGSIFE